MAPVKQTVLFKILCEVPRFTHVPVKVFVSPGLKIRKGLDLVPSLVNSRTEACRSESGGMLLTTADGSAPLQLRENHNAGWRAGAHISAAHPAVQRLERRARTAFDYIEASVALCSL